jgi:hypothetical protein
MYIDNEVFLYKTFLECFEKAIAQRQIEELKSENEKLKTQLNQKNNLDKLKRASALMGFAFQKIDAIRKSIKRERLSCPGTGRISTANLDVLINTWENEMMEACEKLKEVLHPGYPHSDPD